MMGTQIDAQGRWRQILNKDRWNVEGRKATRRVRLIIADDHILVLEPQTRFVVAASAFKRQALLQILTALPGNRFEALKGKRKGQYSIRINDQWRVCFEWPERSPGPINVEIVDYH